MLAPYTDTGSYVSLAGTISRYEKKTNSAGYLLTSCILTDSGQQFPVSSSLYLYTEDHTLPIGSVVCLRGQLSLPQEATNPGQFDSPSYYRQKGVCALVFADEVSVLENPPKLYTPELARRLQTRLSGILSQLSDGEPSAILQAMLLGDKTEISQDTRSLFQSGGILHILTISGMHLYLFGMGIFRLLVGLRIPHRASSFLTLLCIWFYVLMTGCQTAVLRAGIMFTILLGARLFGRSYDQATALGAAVILMLLWNRELILNSSFQLSVTAILGTAVILPGFTEKSEEEQEAERASLRRRKAYRLWKLMKKMQNAFFSALILNAVMVPLILYYFFELPVFSLAATLILLPTVPWLMILAVTGLVAGVFSIPAGSVLLLPAVWMLRAYDLFLRVLTKLPASSLILGRPELWQIGLYALWLLVLLSLVHGPRAKWPEGSLPGRITDAKKRLFGILLLPLLVVLLLPVHREDFSITLMDVGQGDCILVRSGQAACLIDGGSSDQKQISSYVISPALRSQGIGRLQAVFLTHPDDDHCNGIIQMLSEIAEGTEHICIEGLYVPEWMSWDAAAEAIFLSAEEAGVPVYLLTAGDQLTLGDSCFTVLYPAYGAGKDLKDPNEGSLVLKLENRGFTALFTGDLPGEQEALLTEEFACDFLKLAHHGSGFSTTEDFLRRFRPRIAGFSCGRKNRYGHPAPDMLERLEQAGTVCYGTVQSGALKLSRKQGAYYMEGFLDSEAFHMIK